MAHRFLFSSGGTGGHMFPAQAVAKQILIREPNSHILFIGGDLKGNRCFDRGSFAFEEIACSSLSHKKLLSLIKGGGNIAKGFIQSRKVIKNFNPHVVVGFGSFHTFPTLAAASMTSVPIVLHEGNAIPGKVNKLFSRYSRVTGIHFPEAATLLRGKTVEVGMPMRKGYSKAFGYKDEARDYFGLDREKFTILIFGGSQGAMTINAKFSIAAIDIAHRMKDFQVVHLTGSAVDCKECRRLYKGLGVGAYVAEFEERMDLAWLAADLFIGRAGASTIAEQLEFEVPGIYVPYPYAADNHQESNADFVVSDVKGAVKVMQKDIADETLCNAVFDIVGNEQEKLKEFVGNIRAFKEKRTRRDLCSLVCEVAGMDMR